VTVAESTPDACSECGSAELRQDEDVLDTWFSSALWPFATLGWPEETPELRAWYPNDVSSTDRGIIFLWEARMIMAGLELMHEIPFHTVNIHSTINAPDGRRMSKSLGTGIDPLETIDAHGADATRYGLLKMSSTQDVRFSVGSIEEGRKLTNKLWNVSRLLLTNAGGARPEPRPRDVEERWILARLDATRAELEDDLAAYDFAHAVSRLYRLTFDDFCDWYAEAIKPRLYDGDGDARATALAALERLLKLLHPVMPHVTEEIWSHLPARSSRLIVAPWPERDDTYRGAADALASVQEAAEIFRRSRVRAALEGDDLRIFEAVVRPGRRPEAGTRRRRSHGCRRRSPAPKGSSRTIASCRTRPATWSRRSGRSSRATGGSSMRSALEYVDSLSPWPKDGFGLDRITGLLSDLGDPQLRYPSIHVVGTNGKSTVTRTTEELLAQAGLAVGAYLSPHVRGWSERIRVRGEEADFERAIERVRKEAERRDATQFELITAAALAEFAVAEVDVAVVEAGLGGRHDATNVLRSPVQVLTNVALEHTEVLGTTREAIAAEKLAVVQPGATVVLGEPEWEELARENGAEMVVVTGRSNLAIALAAAEAFLGRPVDGHVDVELPGRLQRVNEDPLEIWDGAHNLSGVGYVLARLPSARYVLVVSILADKDVEGMLAALSPLGDRFVATSSSSARALAASDLTERARRYFREVEAIEQPQEALARARSLGEPVLVTGSLYLLADLAKDESVRWRTLATG
jgi:folylpolyglutamate synthase/dihydropteroate synthase